MRIERIEKVACDKARVFLLEILYQRKTGLYHSGDILTARDVYIQT
jgi:hypothetical protein